MLGGLSWLFDASTAPLTPTLTHSLQLPQNTYISQQVNKSTSQLMMAAPSM